MAVAALMLNSKRGYSLLLDDPNSTTLPHAAPPLPAPESEPEPWGIEPAIKKQRMTPNPVITSTSTSTPTPASNKRRICDHDDIDDGGLFDTAKKPRMEMEMEVIVGQAEAEAEAEAQEAEEVEVEVQLPWSIEAFGIIYNAYDHLGTGGEIVAIKRLKRMDDLDMSMREISCNTHPSIIKRRRRGDVVLCGEEEDTNHTVYIVMQIADPTVMQSMLQHMEQFNHQLLHDVQNLHRTNIFHPHLFKRLTCYATLTIWDSRRHTRLHLGH